MAAYAFTVLLMRRSILTEKVARRGYHITREYGIDPLELLRVADVMDKEVHSVAATMKVSEFADLVAGQDPGIMRHRAIPVVDEQKRLVSIVTHDDVISFIKSSPEKTVLEIGAGCLSR